MDAADLRAWRARHRWSQTRLAEELGISVSRLRDYEAGHTYTQVPRSAPIPRVVVLALETLAAREAA